MSPAWDGGVSVNQERSKGQAGEGLGRGATGRPAMAQPGGRPLGWEVEESPGSANVPKRTMCAPPRRGQVSSPVNRGAGGQRSRSGWWALLVSPPRHGFM